MGSVIDFEQLRLKAADKKQSAALDVPLEETFATKADLERLRQEFEAKLEELRREMRQVEAELRARLKRLETETLRWFLISQCALVAVVLGALAFWR